MYSQNQIPLILEKKTSHGSSYEIYHEGIQFLRNLANKKLRVILNISTGVNISSFAETFMTGIISEQRLTSMEGLVSILTIGRDFEIVSPDQILVMFNSHQPSSNCNYLLFGYFISSIVIYHNDGELNPKTDLINILSNFQEKLKMTNIKQLNSQIKLTSGFDKKPFFVCLMHNINKDQSLAKQNFMNFFKNISNNSSKQIKRSSDAILDYLSNRTAFYLSHDKQTFSKKCSKMKNSFLMTLVKRRILNYQVTGSAIQNLCLEFFAVINSKQQNIDLVNLYSQVINNQKRRVFTQSIDFYMKRISTVIRSHQMPYAPQQLFQFHTNIIKQVYEYVNIMAISCMNLQQYIYLWVQITKKMQQTFFNLQITNGKASQQYNATLREELSGLQLQQIQLLVDEINTKIDHYTYQSRGLQSKDNLSQLCKSLLDEYSSKVNRKIKELENKNLEIQIAFFEMRLKVSRLQDQNKQLIRQYERNIQDKQEEIANRIKQQNVATAIYSNSNDKQIDNYRLLIKQLEQQILRKHAEIQDMKYKLNDYENKLSKQKGKPKGEITYLVKQLSISLKQFDKLFTRMQKVDDIVKQSKKQIQRQKQQIAKQKDKFQEGKYILQQKNKYLILQQDQYKKNISKAQETIQLFKQIVQHTKNNLQINAHDIVNQKIRMADMQTKILVYHKCIQLICDAYKKGKNDTLIKFLKLIQHNDIRDYVTEMMKK